MRLNRFFHGRKSVGRSAGGAGLLRRAGIRFVILLAAGLISSGPAVAQEPLPSATDAERVGEPAAPGGTTGATGPTRSSDPLPTPRTDRAYWHLFIAFGIAWALLFGYAVLLNRRLATAERELERMGGR